MPAPNNTIGPRLLIIDNYDSYTFNLYQYFIRANKGREPVVIRNDQFIWEDIKANILPYFDGVVISPGPGKPSVEKDFGVCAKVLLECTLPILGVCLGHQGLATVLGGNVIKASAPVHGQISSIYHDGKDIFHSIPSPFNAVRYHSLVVSHENIPSDLFINAWCDEDKTQDPLIMGFKHLSKPIWTVQFHPESICTEYGQIIVNNFCNLVRKHWSSIPSSNSEIPLPETLANISVVPSPLVQKNAKSSKASFHALVSRIDYIVDSESAFSSFHANDIDTFWLDSARIEKGLSRYSYMGSLGGPNRIVSRFQDGNATKLLLDDESNFFEYLASLMDASHCDTLEHYPLPLSTKSTIPPFLGGLVGYIGYEMKSETLCLGSHQPEFETKANSPIPDSSFLFSDRTIVFDHEDSKIYIIALVPLADGKFIHGESRKIQTCWIDKTSNCLQSIQKTFSTIIPKQEQAPVKKIPELKLVHDKSEYVDMIRNSIEMIREGDTYEVCLTTQLQAFLKKGHPHPFELYKHLRHRNPAPYAAYLSLGPDLVIASSSPERFLRVDEKGIITMKPIKGTLKRATSSNFKGTQEEIERENEKRCQELATSEKNRSENLMIVDLIRNDLNQISQLDSVHVPALMVVESYATVHQLVTTVASTLRPELSPVDAVMRSFPPGSMTGAPKLRTVQLIEKLEKIPRGPYSGVLGFFSVSGPADFNVVIRTSVFSKRKDYEETMVSVGAGGAIVVLSDPKEEFDEMVLKAHSVLPSLGSVYKDYFQQHS